MRDPKMPTCDLVIFLDEDWDKPPLGFTRKRLILALAKQLEKTGSKILCLDRPICPVVTTIKYPYKLYEWLIGRRGLRRITKNICLFTPWMFLQERLASLIPGIVKANRLVLKNQILKCLQKIDSKSKRRIVWISHPYQKDMINILGEDLIVFECYDDYPLYCPHSYIKKVEQLENIILRSADVVLTTSKGLYENRKMKNENTYVVPNGVDYELFAIASNNPLTVPDDIKGIKPPRVGFVGKVNHKIDFTLVNSIVRLNHNWNFIFIGPNDGSKDFQVSNAFQQSQKLSNIHFLGGKPYNELPKYIRSFDVCIIPFVRSELTYSIYPLKLNEYLAVGKPVVSTRFCMDLEEFQDTVRLADIPGKFISAIKSSLEENNLSLVKRRQEIARANSWNNRAKRILEIIEQHLEGK